MNYDRASRVCKRWMSEDDARLTGGTSMAISDVITRGPMDTCGEKAWAKVIRETPGLIEFPILPSNEGRATKPHIISEEDLICEAELWLKRRNYREFHEVLKAISNQAAVTKLLSIACRQEAAT